MALEHCETYAPDQVAKAVRAGVDAFGGMGRFVRPGQRVLLKPNLLAPEVSSKAVTTHPAVVEAVLGLVRECGGDAIIGDSPGLASARRVARKCGIAEVAARCGVPVVPFTEPVAVPAQEGQLFRQIELARTVAEAGVVINLPKLKTHGQMLMTMAVKNLFGCVVGRRKAQWHMRAGRDFELFARLLVEVCRAARPALHIVDAVVAMHGNGPGSGDPIPLGFVAVSDDPVALDSVLCRIVGVEPLDVLTTRLGAQHGLGIADPERIEIIGAGPAALRPKRFDLPRIVPVEFGPAWLRRLLRGRLRHRPDIRPDRCELCGVCVDACPAEAMTLADSAVTIDPARCISCFCCQELCPHGAISIQRSRVSRLLFR